VKWAGCWFWAARKKEKKEAGLGWEELVCFVFFNSFSFISFSSFYSKPFQKF
jgi:hypothetical protein